MKRTLPVVCLFSALTLLSFGQCDPQSYDWAGATYGVSPNPTLGETFEVGQIGVPYSDVVYVLTPATAGDINPELGSFIMIDSLRLDSITIFNGLADVQLSTIGLNLTCNNNGDSPDPCMFMPSSAYCGDISGTPTAAGTFNVKIFATIFFNLFGPQELPYAFEGYSLTVNGTVSTEDAQIATLRVGQNSPNPASEYTNITFDLPQAADVNFTMTNMVGEILMSKTIRGKKGENLMRIETNELQTGIYLYTVQVGEKRFTRKMIVQN